MNILILQGTNISKDDLFCDVIQLLKKNGIPGHVSLAKDACKMLRNAAYN